MRARPGWLSAALLAGACLTAASAPLPLEEDATRYAATPAVGIVSELERRLERGEARLEFAPEFGYLPALLRELRIPPSSQLLVASKTSPNKSHISPKNPRALYFSDQVSLAFVPGASLIELAAHDRQLGSVFYTLEQQPAGRPRLVRDNRCLECHSSSKTLQVPGWLVRSFATHADGEVDMLAGLMVNHRTPIAERWGGYYVTGQTGGQPHRGNRFDAEAIPASRGGPPPGLELPEFPWGRKFPEPGSDVAALLVFDHQVHMMNLLARLRAEVEVLPESEPLSRVESTTQAVLQYLLFVDEAPLQAPVAGSSGFRRAFEASGLADAQGRSLRQLDLKQHLQAHPCSFMIASPSFDALPLRARRHLYRRLWDILSGAAPPPTPRLVSAESRNALREILLATRKELPVYWTLP